jgi:hypothetical protein
LSAFTLIWKPTCGAASPSAPVALGDELALALAEELGLGLALSLAAGLAAFLAWPGFTFPDLPATALCED